MLTPETLILHTYETERAETEDAFIVVRFASGKPLTTVRLDTSSDDPHLSAVKRAVRSFGPVNVEYVRALVRGGTYAVTPRES